MEMARRRLLLAFSEVLSDGGLETAGVGRICDRAGVSRRTFYALFRDREDCFSATFAAAVEQVASAIVPAGARHERWSARLRAGLAALLCLLDEEPALLSVCLIESLKAAPRVLRQRRHALDALAAVVDEGRSAARRRIEPAPLTAESIVGGAVSVICTRALEDDPQPLSGLLNPLMSMIVQPYLGPIAARRELERDTPPPQAVPQPAAGNGEPGDAPRRVREPFKDLPIRITFRTARVLDSIAAQPGASNRQVGDAAGIADQGQMSKLLSRLLASALIENHGGGGQGERNSWRLTERGEAVQSVIELP